MNIAPTSVVTPVQSLAPSQAVADVLPKNGEAGVDALFAPVEKLGGVSYSSEANKEPIVYTKPKPVNDEQAVKADQDLPDSIHEAIKEDLQEEAELQQLQELKARDQEVRTHEQAHKAMGGQHAGAVSYTFQQGPDGNRYAVGGEVSIDMSEVADDPQATLEKMQQIERAALAPNEPSSQDRQIAAQAGQKAAQAMAEISQEKLDKAQEAELALKEQREKLEQEKAQAKKEQEEADKKAEKNEQTNAAERMAQYNYRMSRINETLLRLSMPAEISAGQILNARV